MLRIYLMGDITFNSYFFVDRYDWRNNCCPNNVYWITFSRKELDNAVKIVVNKNVVAIAS